MKTAQFDTIHTVVEACGNLYLFLLDSCTEFKNCMDTTTNLCFSDLFLYVYDANARTLFISQSLMV
jgi:hypothetical protein